MIPISWLCWDVLIIVIFIGLLILDRQNYRIQIKRKEIKSRKKKEAEKKKSIELKWPDDLPRMF